MKNRYDGKKLYTKDEDFSPVSANTMLKAMRVVYGKGFNRMTTTEDGRILVHTDGGTVEECFNNVKEFLNVDCSRGNQLLFNSDGDILHGVK